MIKSAPLMLCTKVLIDREFRSKALKEALLLLLLMAWKHDHKMIQMEQIMFANKNCSCAMWYDLAWPYGLV